MSDDSPQRDPQIRDRWIEVLLESATRPEDHGERIDRAMSRIGVTAPEPASRTRRWRTPWRTLALVAATVVVLFVMFPRDGMKTAMAAVERSLSVATEPTIRKYKTRVKFRRPFVGPVEIESDLYVKGADRFAVHHQGLLPRAQVWLGHDGDEAWVLPAIGPVQRGDDTVVSRWLAANGQLETPFLHISTILTRMMSRGYRLETRDDEQLVLPSGEAVACERIRATEKSSSAGDSPDIIDLWVSHESGMAMQIVASWKLNAVGVGRESMVVTFEQDEPDLTDEWFTPEAHISDR